MTVFVHGSCTAPKNFSTRQLSYCPIRWGVHTLGRTCAAWGGARLDFRRRVMVVSSSSGSHWTADAARDRVGAEMVRAAVAEFLGMERNLREAAKHLAAAQGIGDGVGSVP